MNPGQSQSYQKRGELKHNNALELYFVSQWMHAIHALWMCPLLSLFTSQRHSSPRARFRPWILHPSPRKCCYKVHMPNWSAPHPWTNYELKSMFLANSRLGFRPSQPFFRLGKNYESPWATTFIIINISIYFNLVVVMSSQSVNKFKLFSSIHTKTTCLS